MIAHLVITAVAVIALFVASWWTNPTRNKTPGDRK